MPTASYKIGTYGLRHYSDGRTVVLADTRRYVEREQSGKTEFSVPAATPNYWKRKNAGELLANPYYITETSWHQPPTSVHVSSICTGPNPDKKAWDEWHEWYEPREAFAGLGLFVDGKPPVQDPPWSKESLRNKALQRANADVWNASESLAELGETAVLVADCLKAARAPLRTLLDVLTQSARKQRLDIIGKYSLKQLLDDASKGWLIWRYGVRPLISDIQSACEAYNRRAKLKFRKSARPSGTWGEPYTLPIKVMTKPTETTKLPLSVGRVFSDSALKGRYVITTDYEYESLMMLYRDDLGFMGVEDAVKVAWELVPCSFVFDWFINVSKWLEMIDTPTGATERIATYSLKKRGLEVRHVNPARWTQYNASSNETWTLQFTGFEIRSEFNTFERTVEPPGVIILPEVGQGLNLVRSMDLAAIFIQLSRLVKRPLRVG